MAVTMDATTTVCRSDRVAYRKLTDGAGGVLLNLDTAAYHGVNEIGALIWSVLEDGPTLGAVISRVRDEVPDAPARLGDDVAAFLADLAERRLVSVGPADEHRPATPRGQLG